MRVVSGNLSITQPNGVTKRTVSKINSMQNSLKDKRHEKQNWHEAKKKMKENMSIKAYNSYAMVSYDIPTKIGDEQKTITVSIWSAKQANKIGIYIVILCVWYNVSSPPQS